MAKKNKKIDLKFDGSTATWQLTETGAINGTYIGTFKFRCFLTPLQRIAANREYRELLGPSASIATDTESFLAFALTQLRYRIIEAPPFWMSEPDEKSGVVQMPGNLPDENIIASVLDAAIRAEQDYKLMKKQEQDEAVKRFRRAAEKAINQLNKPTEEDDEAESESEENSDQS